MNYLHFFLYQISFDKFLHLPFHSFSFKLLNQHLCYITNKGKHRCFWQKFDSLFRLNFSQNIIVHISLSSLESMLLVRKCIVKLSNYYSRKTVLLNMALTESHGGPHSIQTSSHKRSKFPDGNYEGLSPDSLKVQVQISNLGDFLSIISTSFI